MGSPRTYTVSKVSNIVHKIYGHAEYLASCEILALMKMVQVAFHFALNRYFLISWGTWVIQFT